MKVLLIHQAFVSQGEAGGTRHFELARHCVEKGVSFTIVTSPISYLTGRDKRREPGSPFAGIEIIHAYTVKAHHKNFVWRVWAFVVFMFASVVRGLRVREIDVVMGTTPPIFQAVSAWLVAALRRKPFLLEVRDLWPEFAIDMGVLKNPSLIWLSRRLERFLYHRADHLLVNSPAYRTYLLDKGIAADKITFIANGVDVPLFEVQSDGTFRRRFALEDKFLLVYAGALGLANDIATLLRAMALLKNRPAIHLLLAGDGKEKENLQRLAAKLHVASVTFAGSVAKSDIPALLSEANVCVAILQNIPMFKTTYPNKVFDYMAAGKPVLLAIDGVIREVVEQAQCGIYAQPGDARALAERIVYLYEHRQEAIVMGEHGRLYVQAHFNRRQQADAFYQLLNTLPGQAR